MLIGLFNNLGIKDKTLKRIAIVTVILLSLFFIKGLNLICALNRDLFKDVSVIYAAEEIIVMTQIILCIMILSICFIYYRGLKRKEFFGISLVYVSIITEMIFIVLTGDIVENQVYDLNLFSFLFRGILLLLAVLCLENFDAFIRKYKKITLVFVILVTVILQVLNVNYNLGVYKYNPIYNLTLILIVLAYISCIIVCLVKIFKFREITYLVIMISASLMLLKLVYGISLSITNNNLIKINIVFFNFISFMSFVFGMFFDSLQVIKNKNFMQEELSAFFNLIEFDCNSEVVLLNNNLKVIYANEKCRSKRISHENIEGKTYSDLEKQIKEFLYDKNIICIESVLRNSKEWKGIIKLNGEDEVVKVNLQKIKKEKHLYYVLRINNITEEYKMEKNLRLEEQRLRGVTENIKDLIFTIDVEGKITYVNKAVIDVLGYSEEELIGEIYYDLLLVESNLNIIDSKYLNEDKILTIDKVRSKKGLVQLESISSRIKDNKNNTLGWVRVARNIEDVREIEILKNKFEEIKQYDKVRSEFFANLSHELRTPINIIYSCIQLLNTSKNNKTNFASLYDKYEKTLKQNCFRMLRLVNNLIDITKIDSGFIKMDFINYDIIKLTEDITISVIPYVESKNIDIIFDTDCEELEIKCDPDKIERIILNLLSNAIKFTEPGGKIEVSIFTDENWVDIRVKDTGIGIPSHMKEFIFERFIQNDKSLNRNKEGSGIGLSLVKSLVELHGGKVFLRDSNESGSEFSVLLPNVKLENDIEENGSLDYKTEVEKISIEFADIYEIY
ncbi:PAS domain-containing sensor histidine kinase [Clostridium perfringens]|uniref:PAS domain-containing sensor histidine kinase n=1 Tax=Clostridium perfringens TaxID=1502 RepID=UPI0029732F76|nr:PAS domain-containing sensor histidine kinase [Clostridium perfringens]MDM0474520.1 PAS domain-containing sensor histidine kinase [Clostridium perfringens]MDM0476849.1 PAS domain-containing sensor histidine kinase [Clostridium perfringens]MDM0479842.1 PAS domain-containing sensor histidine kinase [Clostridium perfringens]MDM0485009.1 PAS domain-containing sensor histidine kinase [Clostridium perfringens]